MYAVIHTGGKQYRVAEGETLKVEKLDGKAGDEIQIDQVLFAKASDKLFTGRPKISGAVKTFCLLSMGIEKEVRV